jgi:hypothetical protein
VDAPHLWQDIKNPIPPTNLEGSAQAAAARL